MKRWIFCTLAIVALLLVPLHDVNAQTQRPKVGVALSGGGAKGAAHIGVLKYMEEIGIPVDFITGTSMGSIIGGLYALGYPPDEMARLIAEMDWSIYMSNSVSREYQSSTRRASSSTYLLTVPFGTGQFEERSGKMLSTLPSGVINGASLINLFSRLSVGYNDSIDFSSLPIPFACVATDILTGDSVLLQSGNFAKAIRSSMAIPGVFAPVEWNGHLLADGGLVNNFPVDVCMDMGADVIVGVELAEDLANDASDLRSLPQQVAQYLSIAVRGDRHKHREMCNVYMHPNISGYNMLSFSADAIDTLVRRGYECAKAHHDELMALKNYLESFGPCQKELQAPRAKNFNNLDTIVLSTITYRGVTPEEQKWLNKKNGLECGVPIAASDIERAIGILYGTGSFSTITYQIFETEEEYWLSHHVYTGALGRESYDLVINLTRAEPHVFSFGFRYDSEESSSLRFHAGWNENRLAGYKVGMDVDLNYNFRFGTRVSYCGLGLGDVTLSYFYHSSSFTNTDLRLSTPLTLTTPIGHSNVSLYVSEFHLRDFSFAFGVGEDFYNNRHGYSLNHMLNDEDFLSADSTSNFFGVILRGRYDNLDDPYFATRGTYATGNFGWHKENCYMFNPDQRGLVEASINWCQYLSYSKKLTFIPQLSARMLYDKHAYPNYANLVGGDNPGRYLDQQLAFIGLNIPLYVNNNVGILRLDTRYNITGNFYVSLLANYMCAISHFDKPETLQKVLGLGTRLSYKSPIGPISVDLHWNDFTRSLGAYLNIGYIF